MTETISSEPFDYIENNDLKSLEEFIERYEGVLVRSPKNKFTPFLFAAYCGNLDAVKLIYDKYYYVSVKGKHDMNAVHFAVLRNNLNVLTFLGEKSFDLCCKCRAGFNALHLACREGAYECAQYLLKKKNYLIDSETDDGYRPIQFAAYNKDMKLSCLLINNGAKIDFHFENEEFVSQIYSSDSIYKDEFEKVITKDNDAEFQKLCETYPFMLQKKFNRGSCWSLFCLLIDKKAYKCIKWTLNYDEYVDICNNYNKNHLIYAIEKYLDKQDSKLLDAISLILDKHSYYDSLNQIKQHKIIQKAIPKKATELINLLIDNSFYSIEDFNYMIMYDQTQYLNMILEKCDKDFLNQKDVYGRTPLFTAYTHNKRRDIFKDLLRKGADPFQNSVKYYCKNKEKKLETGDTPLIVGLIKCSKNAFINDIINEFPDFKNHINDYLEGHSMIYYAAESRNNNLVEYLYSNGAEPTDLRILYIGKNEYRFNEFIQSIIKRQHLKTAKTFHYN